MSDIAIQLGRRWQNGKHGTVRSRSGDGPQERVTHREGTPLRRLPDPAIGHQAATLGFCPAARLAQDLVAGLEGPSGQGVLLG